MSQKQCDDMKKELKKLVSQTVCSSIITHIRYGNKDITRDLLKYSLATHLNKCWHLYNKKNDEYLTKIITTILNYNIIRGSICLFNWIKIIGDTMFDIIDFNIFLEDLETFDILDQKRDFIIHVSNDIFNDLDLELESMMCDGNECDSTYNGSDIFTIQIDSEDKK